jgi:hypothetical protein
MAVYTLRVIKSGRTVLRKQVSDGLGRDAVVIPAQADVTYLLSDPLSNTGPDKISAKRVGKNLHISLGKGNPDTPDLVIEGYFDFPVAQIAGSLADGGQAAYDLGALAQASPSSTTLSSAPDNTVTQASLPSDGFDKSKLMLGGLGLLALGGAGGGGGGGSGATSASVTALLNKVSAYADDNTKSAPELADYEGIGITGIKATNLSAINSAVDALSGTKVDTKDELQVVVDAYLKILAEANGPDADTTPANPSANDYAAIGATIGLAASNAAALSLLNTVVGNLSTTGVDTITEINALATVVDKLMNAAAGSPATLTISDYALLGLPTSGAGAITSTNLEAVNNAITSAGGQARIDTYAELSALVISAATIATYANDGTQTAPTANDYANAGISGVSNVNLAAINNAIDTLALNAIDTKSELQAVIDAYVKILAEANGSAGDATTTNPTVSDYALIGSNIGLSATNTAALSLLNTVVGNLPTTGVDTVAKINALAVVVDKLMAAALGSPAALTVADYALLGLPTVGAGAVAAANLTIVNNAIASVGGQARIDTYAELSGLITGVITIVNYAADGTQLAPTTTDYANAGITGVTSTNLLALNSAVDSLTANAVDTKDELQAMVDAYLRILAEANGGAADATPGTNPLASDYALVGANIGSATSNTAALSLLNTVIGNLPTTGVDTISEINALAIVVDKLMVAAAGSPATLTLADYALLGLPVSGPGAVTATNLSVVNNAITASGGQSRIDTYAELAALVTAVATIVSYANDNTQTAPTAADYANAGITGVNSSNLAALNNAVDTLNAAAVDTKAELQAVVDAYLKILAEANGNAADSTPGSNPSASDYALIGAAVGLSATNPAALSLLNNVIGNLSSDGVDTIAEINALAAVIDKVMNAAAGNTPTLTVADYALLGIPTSGAGAITPSNLAAVNDALMFVGSQARVDTFAELSTLVTAVATIVNFADDNTQAAPTLAQYSSAGINGVTAANLSAINSALDANNAAGVDTKAELQAIVDTYNLILAEANGSTSDATPGVNPSAAQFALIGANIGAASTNSINLSLLNDAIANLSNSAVDTIAEINEIAAASNAVIAGAAGSTAPSLAQLTSLGITGVTANNLLAIQNAIAATADSGLQVDTISELQAIVTTTANAASISQTRIQNYANSSLNTAPTVADYVNIGVTGVETGNLASINSAVDALTTAGVDTPFEVQTVVNAYNAILAEANGSAVDATPGVNPTANQFLAIGASIGLASGGVASGTDLASSALSLLDSAVANMVTTAVDTVGEINAAGAAIDRVMNLARLATSTPIPAGTLTMADLTLLGIDTSLANTTAEVNAILQAIIDSADSGAGVSTIQALQALVNANVS